MKNEYRLSFLIPTLGNRRDELVRLLDTVKQQTYSNIEVVVVIQDNFDKTAQLCQEYTSDIDIKTVIDHEKGLSKARNTGLRSCSGDIIVLSDDDCWYPDDAAEKIAFLFDRTSADVLLTQLRYNNADPKRYSSDEGWIKSSFQLLSRASIEIAFKRKHAADQFDEKFGLGARFACGEEIDFLIRLLRGGANIYYAPEVTVYHPKKVRDSSDIERAAEAKGALYCKHFNLFIGLLVCIKDLLKKGQNNFKAFTHGYNSFKKQLEMTQ